MENLLIFLIIAFILPLIMVFTRREVSNAGIDLVMYGIQAASPSIAAIAVFLLNRELRSAFSRLFRADHLMTAIALPVILVCAVMLSAKLITILIICPDHK